MLKFCRDYPREIGNNLSTAFPDSTSAKVFQNKVNKPYKSQNQAGKPKAKNAWKSTKGAWCNHCKVATHDTTRCFYLIKVIGYKAILYAIISYKAILYAIT